MLDKPCPKREARPDEPDPGGFGYWLDKLGAGQTSRPDLLAFFCDSNENVAGTADATGDGVWFV
ncbi:DUF4214 domain-containing protein [Mesorhizobium sp. PUT5]|uniref:DUF4214 domain-containing protein n=1 Tax=Mesorhizobium sp. PUT5 TaxID=3454629 RepID=UPI003FA42FF2